MVRAILTLKSRRLLDFNTWEWTESNETERATGNNEVTPQDRCRMVQGNTLNSFKLKIDWAICRLHMMSGLNIWTSWVEGLYYQCVNVELLYTTMSYIQREHTARLLNAETFWFCSGGDKPASFMEHVKSFQMNWEIALGSPNMATRHAGSLAHN